MNGHQNSGQTSVWTRAHTQGTTRTHTRSHLMYTSLKSTWTCGGGILDHTSTVPDHKDRQRLDGL